MSFLNKMKKKFSGGGIGVDLDSPESFRWSDDSLAVRVRLRNKADEPRTVTGLEFTLNEDPSESAKSGEALHERHERERRIAESAIRFTHDEAVTVPAGEERILEIDFPLSLAGALEATEESPGWISAASKAMQVVGGLSRGSGRFIVAVSCSIDGFGMSKTAHNNIRALGVGQSETRFGVRKPKF